MVELRSPNDSLKVLQDKMQEYIDNDVKLGWLIDHKHKKVYIYRAQMTVKCLENPLRVGGEPVLLGFVLDLSKIW